MKQPIYVAKIYGKDELIRGTSPLNFGKDGWWMFHKSGKTKKPTITRIDPKTFYLVK